MLAFFQSSGTVPSSTDLLYIIVSGTVMQPAASRSNIGCKYIVWTWRFIWLKSVEGLQYLSFRYLDLKINLRRLLLLSRSAAAPKVVTQDRGCFLICFGEVAVGVMDVWNFATYCLHGVHVSIEHLKPLFEILD